MRQDESKHAVYEPVAVPWEHRDFIPRITSKFWSGKDVLNHRWRQCRRLSPVCPLVSSSCNQLVQVWKPTGCISCAPVRALHRPVTQSPPSRKRGVRCTPLCHHPCHFAWYASRDLHCSYFWEDRRTQSISFPLIRAERGRQRNIHGDGFRT